MRWLSLVALVALPVYAQTFTPVASDDFESYTPGGSPGANWDQLEGFNCFVYSVAGKGVDASHAGADCLMRRSAGAYSTEQYADAKVLTVTGSTSNISGPCVRQSADTFSSGGMDAYCVGLFDDTVQAVHIYKVLNNTKTSLDSVTGVGVVSGDVLRILAEGTGGTVTLTAYLNGSAITGLSAADSSSPITAAGRPGVLVRGPQPTTTYLDDWVGGDYTAGGGGGTVVNPISGKGGAAARPVN